MQESTELRNSRRRSGRPIVAVITALGLALGVMVRPTPAAAEGAPIQAQSGVEVSVATTTLYGRSISVAITVPGNAAADAFNLAFTTVIPFGVDVVAGSTQIDGRSNGDPTTVRLEDGSTHLTWVNVSDLLAGTSAELTFDLLADTGVYAVGDAIDIAAQTFVSSDPRMLPTLEGETGMDVTATTRLSPFDLIKTERSAEAELLRGLTAHQTVFTLAVENNLINPTKNFSIVDHVPAGLEFLGCANSTVEMSNPCVVPSEVTTVTTDPDGDGPMTEGVYTRIEWDTATLAGAFGTADLQGGGAFAVDYVAAIPLRRNSQMDLDDPTNNLSNNTGTLTADEEAMLGHGRALGDYDGTLPSIDDDTELVIAEDVSIHLNASSSTFVHGSETTWNMVVESSQYALSTEPIVVTHDLPDGLDVTAADPPLDAGFPVTNADGTLSLRWTLAGFDRPNVTDTISFSASTRATYRATGRPVAARDAWTGGVNLSTTSAVVSDEDGTTSQLSIVDASSDAQLGAGPTITKEIATPSADMSCNDGSPLDYTSGVAGPFGPGDSVCWRLTVDLPERLDLLDLVVEDYLPAGLKFEGQVTTPTNDVPMDSVFEADGSVLSWEVGNVAASAERFQVIVHTVVDDPAVADPSDLVGNLMKVRFTNTQGQVFQLRDEAEAEWGEPLLGILSGVGAINDVTVPGAPADGVLIEAGDIVTNQVVVENSGNRDALGVSARHTLAQNIECDQISGISHEGQCSSADSWIQWDGISVSAGSTLTVTYDLEVPAGISAAATLTSIAGVRSYQSATNTGARFTFVPVDNIDVTLTSNTGSAVDPWSIRTARPTISAAQSTSISESGNNRGTQATIGEVVSYFYDVTLPKGTTFYGPVTLTSSLGSRLDLVESTFTATLDDASLPAAWNSSSADNQINMSLSSAHAVNAVTDQIIRISFDAIVTDVSINARSARIDNSLRLQWTDEHSRVFEESASVLTRVVEPALDLTKVHDDADSIIESGQIYGYTLEVANVATSRSSTAHDIVVADIVAPQLTVLDELGQPVLDGASVGAEQGRWDAAAGTITWSHASIAPGTAVSLSYDVRAAAPLVANAPIAGNAEVTASSIAGASISERSATSQYGSFGSGYRVGATDSATVSNFGVDSDVLTPSATIGEAVDVALAVTIPAETIGFDVTVIDDLPVGLTYESLIDVRCETDEPSCPATLPVRTDGDRVAFILGDLTTPMENDRTIVINYRAVVADVAAVDAPMVLSQSAVAYLNQSDVVQADPATMPSASSFDSATIAASDGTSVVEPALTIDKATDTQRGAPGSTISYSIVVTNPAAAASSAAYGVTVSDAPDTRLIAFVDETLSTDVDLIDGDHSDGSLAWHIPGPLLPGASVTISYELTVPQGLDWNDEVVVGREVFNTADVSSYYGVSSTERVLFPNRTYREYDDVDDDTVGIELDLASIRGQVWNDADVDHLRDADEEGLTGVSVAVTYLGLDGRAGGDDDEVFTAVTGYDGVWTATALPGGQYMVEIDDATLPAGFIPTYDSVRGAVAPTGDWSGTVAENGDVRGVDAGFGAPMDDGDTASGKNGDVWIAAVKPNGTGYVRMRTADGTWSSWYQQGSARIWATLSVNTDRAGNVWVMGIKLNGEAYVRVKTPEPGVRAGWSTFYRQGSGGWSSMSLSTDPAGNVWVVGVKANGLAYARVKNATAGIRQGWSRWTRLGSISWSGIAMATDTTGQLWLAGVTRGGSSYVLRRDVGGAMTTNWSSWMRQGSGTDWESMSLATDSEDSIWLSGVKQSGTAYLRQKVADPSLTKGWSSWLQLGGSKSWSSMTLTVDGSDTLWIAGVKQSGTAYVRMKCICVGIDKGWSKWVQQGAANSWDTLHVVNDPANRVLLAGVKLGGTSYTRTKANVAGVLTGWSGWTQHAGKNAWDSFSAHSDSWVGVHPPRNPSLETRDEVWIAPAGWVPSSDADGKGLLYWC